MSDWNKLVRQRLGALNLPPSAQEEVVRELAGHMQDIYEQKVAEGVCEPDALELAFKQVTNWRPLAKNIERAKRKEGIMNQRSKQFWLPALLSLAASMIWLMVIELTAEKLHMPWRYTNVAFMPYVMWIISLPLIGAASGRVSYRAGSKRTACLMAIAFPALMMFVMWFVMVAFLLIRKGAPTPHALSVGYGFLFWVLIPGIALLLGTAPLSRQKPGCLAK